MKSESTIHGNLPAAPVCEPIVLWLFPGRILSVANAVPKWIVTCYRLVTKFYAERRQEYCQQSWQLECGKLIQIISVRDMKRKERNTYDYHEKIPKFKSEAEERNFWASADSSEYIDWSKARRLILPNLKPSVKTISLRLPELMLEELKLLANKRDVPYQSLIKIFISERLAEELKI